MELNSAKLNQMSAPVFNRVEFAEKISACLQKDAFSTNFVFFCRVSVDNLSTLMNCRKMLAMEKIIILLLRRYCHVILLVFSASVFGQSFDSTSFNNETRQLLIANDSAATALIDHEFLTVDEAYQLNVSIEDHHVVAEWTIADNYFLYGEKFKFSLQQQNNATPLEASDPVGIIEYDEIFEKDVEKHYGVVRITLDTSQFDRYQPNVLEITSQGCADAGLCYPPRMIQFIVDIDKHLVTRLPSSTESASPIALAKSDVEDNEIEQENQMPLLMFSFALFGGILLNFMPCVFPVLSIKALSIANTESAKTSHQWHGWSYTLGVIATFILFAGGLLLARHTGQALGWGFQLQSPGFVTVLIYLFWVMGLSLSGYITVGAQIMGVGQQLTRGNKLHHSFFTGVLAVVVASPCTAPFMATALGYALTQSNIVALTIFIGLGFGMALPLLLLCHLPQLEKRLPKPGPWMETLKQALAFPLYLTALWLLWVLGRQLDSDAVSLVIFGGIAIVFAYWVHQKGYWLSRVITVATLVLIIFITWTNNHKTTANSSTAVTKTAINDDHWRVYSQELLTELRQQGKPVFINVTADWCITCLANERLVLTDNMLSFMRDRNIELIKADWTNYNAQITQLLQNYGRSGIPLYLLFPADANAEAVILPQILTPSGVRKAIENAG